MMGHPAFFLYQSLYQQNNTEFSLCLALSACRLSHPLAEPSFPWRAKLDEGEDGPRMGFFAMALMSKCCYKSLTPIR